MGSPRGKSVIAIIPARYGSTRLPAKPLADLLGKPMIQWTYERARAATTLSRIIVATDDERIASVVHKFGGEALMTDPALPSGTDRVAAVADRVEGDVFVNLQGDEPLMPSSAIDAAVELVTSGRFEMATAMVPLRTQAELKDPAVVKVMADKAQRAVTFSRHPIPYSRGAPPADGQAFACRKHLGLYVYTRACLLRFRALPPSPWETGEMLEQMRALEAGIAIGIDEVDFQPLAVDTPEDLDKVRQALAREH
jgi:3-deoxy-manno-octulosonate cytidylyltransferase (CMP-KDO synthetase)